MKSSVTMESLKEIIKELLTLNPKYRESDRKLCSRIWDLELEKNLHFPKVMTTYNFFDLYSNADFLSDAQSITRIARLIKKENPELEGKKDLRLEEVERVKEVIKS